MLALTELSGFESKSVLELLKKLFDTLNIPIILGTHQYEDAQFFGARVAVMMNGVIEQIGSYNEIIKHPKTSEIKKILVPFSQHENEPSKEIFTKT